MSILVLLLVLVVANIIYVTAFFAGSIRLGVYAKHYFLGIGRALFTLNICGVEISVGLYLPAFSHIYTVIDGQKERLKYPWEFREQPLLRRLGVTLCGPVALIIAGILTFILITYTQDQVIIPRSEVNRLGIYPSATAEIAGFKRGDRILKLNGEEYEDFYELVELSVLESRDTYYTVLRDGKEVNVSLNALPEGFTPDHNEYFISLLAPFTIREVAPSTPAAEAGLEYGDKITHVNGEPIIKYYEVLDAVNNDTTGRVTITIERMMNDSIHTFNTNLTADSMIPGRNRIGIVPNELYTTTSRRSTFIEAIIIGTRTAFFSTTRNITAFFRLFLGQLSMKRQVGGPIGITKASNGYFYLYAIGTYTMFFAFANFLPLPRSAFWELIALGYEAATRKQLPFNVFKVLRKIALALIIACIVLLFFFDIAGLFF